MIKIVRASKEQLEDVVSLFDAYRVFYKMQSDTSAARLFLSQRIQQNESAIFLAYIEGVAVGFTQIYPMFSSVSMQPLFVLNDLYVQPSFRGQGIGEQLLLVGKQYTIDHKGKSLILETGMDNPAQHLYERLGWKKDTEYYHYSWSADSNS